MSVLIISCKSTISFHLSQIKSFIRFFGNIPSICFNSSFLLKTSRDFIAPTCFSVCFSKTFPKGAYANLPCSIICFWLEGNISSPVRYSYLSIFPDDYADIFVAFLLISCCSFSSLILSSIVTIIFYILSKRFFLNQEGLSNVRVVSVTKKDFDFAEIFF